MDQLPPHLTTPAEAAAVTGLDALAEAPKHPAHPVQAGETILIVNPGARLVGAGDYDAALLESELRERGLDAYLCETISADETTEIARQAALVGAAMVVVVGGDGAIHAVVDGLLRGTSPELVGERAVATGGAIPAPGQARRGATTALGIIPAGTMNNVASALGIPEDTTQALDILGAGETQPLDVGLLDGQPFIEVAGFGVVAELMPLGERVKGHPWAIFSVFSAVFDILRRARPSRVWLVLDGHGRWVRALQVTVSNTPSYGARFEVAPGARTDDGWLDVTALIGINGWDVASHLLALVGFKMKRRDWRVRRFRARSVIVRPKAPWSTQIDGDPYCVMGPGTPQPSLEARALPGALRVCAPVKRAGAEQPEGAIQTLMRALPFQEPRPAPPSAEPQATQETSSESSEDDHGAHFA